ncbi:hypothetical protein [Rhizobium sp.]|uniref:hypothetical protein n=1 Tax=Rhizobium sp. TaxID=391 RepID=UPI0034C64060
MSRAIGQHMKAIREQRQILDDWTAYEYDLNSFFQTETPKASIMAGTTGSFSLDVSLDYYLLLYHQQLDFAEARLKTAASKGGVVDITDTPMGHDLRCVSNATIDTPKADKLRIRANLVRLDFYERFGRLPETYIYKLTIPHIAAPKPDAPIADLALAIQVPRYEPVVLASFSDQADAMLYRLAIS